jgi:hypothetical protein
LLPEQTRQYLPGITWRSLGACLFALVVMGIYIQYAEVTQNGLGAIAEQALPIPAITLLLALALGVGVVQVLTRHQLLTRQERFCVLCALLIAAPMMTQGMWHRFVGIIAASPRDGNFHYLDAYNDKLWPHGPNLVEGILSQERQSELTPGGTPFSWEQLEVTPKQPQPVLTLANERADQTSTVAITLPLQRDGQPLLVPGQPYLVSFLARPENLGPDSTYFLRLYQDDDPIYREVITSREPATRTFLHQTGFVRTGKYGVEMPPTAQREVRLVIGLQGQGKLAVTDAKCFSVAALEGVYRGRLIIAQRDYDQLPAAQRAGLIVRPDNLLSLAGLKFLVAGYIPLADWAQTALAWSIPIGLLLLALLAIAVIMRKQWAESERYPFPLFQIPYALNGEADEPAGRAFPAIFSRRIMWAGFAVGLGWSLLKGWHFYNPAVPEVAKVITLSDLIDGPGWGDMWKTNLGISMLLLSLVIFFELNVLISFVVGFWLYRSLHWVGEFSGMKVLAGYPFRYEQAIGAYLGYAAVVVFFARKYLGRVVYDAIFRNRAASGHEAVTYRTALLMLGGALVGIGLWAWWLQVSVASVVIYFAFLLTIGFVAAKFRSECGLPCGYFTPYNAMLFVSLLGGMAVFGPSGVLVCLIASGFLTVSVFFFIPGAQVEMLEYGRRYGVVPRHLVYTCIIGILGGLFVGGWVFLANAYAIGGNNIQYQWAFQQGWFFRGYMSQLGETTSQFLLRESGQEIAAAGIKPATWAYGLAALVTAVIAVLRQLFAGFWFHPIGFVVGSAYMLEWAWGSCLAAWAIRLLVLKFGGAATVKNKLFPFFIGVFLGCVVSILVFVLYGAYLQGQGTNVIYTALP